MQNSPALDPEHRVLYGDSLQPPAGYIFDAAIATTFSLDFDTALAVPVSLALSAAENRDELLSNPLALLEGVERIAGRVLIFADAGHIQAQSKPQSRLCSLLEKMILEVVAPRGGAFHPKMWALRFKPLSPSEPIRMRLLVLSRNLTRDRSWDISLCLDGSLTGRSKSVNKPLSRLIQHLVDPTNSIISPEARKLAEQLAQDVRCTDWEVPEPFESVEFAVNGLGGRPWQPEACSKMGIIAPFCDAAVLDLLATLASSEKPTLIGRFDELAAIPVATLEQYGAVSVLDDVAASEDGEELIPDTLDGLHAKAFISEVGWDTTIAVGSGNATRPALVSGKNVELFAILKGKRARVGSVERIMGPAGFGRLTRPFVVGEVAPIDNEARAAELRVEDARCALSRGGLTLRCEPADSGGESLWRVFLKAPSSFPLTGIGSLSVWPITRGEDHSRDALACLRTQEAVDLGTMPMVDLTSFVAFRLIDTTSKASALFSVGLPMEGLPDGRHAAILRWLIDSRDTFLRYLRLLLAEFGDPFGVAKAEWGGGANAKWGTANDDAPLLEEMVRALCAGGERLDAIERLIIRLEAGHQSPSSDPIPADFRALWESFRVARKNPEARDAT